MSHLHLLRIMVGVVFYLAVSSVAAQAQATWHVDDDAPFDPGPGDPTVSDPLEDGSPEHPFDAIQKGINAASDGDTVVLADGTYTGAGNRGLDYGGRLIVVRSASLDPDACIVDCENAATGFYFVSGETADAVLEGITITHGRGPLYDGGGIHMVDSSPTIRQCDIRENSAAWTGAGVCCEGGSPMIRDCLVQDNLAEWHGGGIYCEYGDPTIDHCEISYNTAGYYCVGDGGGIYLYEGSGVVSHCVISYNLATDDIDEGGCSGGGVNSYGGHTIVDCEITNNEASWGSGGGAAVYFDTHVIRCKIMGNHASPYSGAAAGGLLTWRDSVVSGCLIARNYVTWGNGHGGVDFKGEIIENCTIIHNSGRGSGADGIRVYRLSGAPVPQVRNCVLWDNGDESLRVSSTADITYCCVEGGWWGTGNISTDPSFVDADGPDNNPNTWEDNDYRLASDSPCIDAGDNDGVSTGINMDLDRRLRFADRIATPDTGNPGTAGPPVVDMGPYERQCTGDLNGDGMVGLADLAVLLANYGVTEIAEYADGDLDGDTDVDIADLAELLGQYGEICT